MPEGHCPHRADRGGVDDASPAQRQRTISRRHAFRDRARHESRAVQIRVTERTPIFGRVFKGRLTYRGAGVIEQHINRRKMRFNLVQGDANRALIGHFQTHRVGLPAGAIDLSNQMGQLVLPPRCHHHLRASMGKHPRSMPPNAARSTSHQHASPRQIKLVRRISSLPRVHHEPPQTAVQPAYRNLATAKNGSNSAATSAKTAP